MSTTSNRGSVPKSPPFVCQECGKLVRVDEYHTVEACEAWEIGEDAWLMWRDRHRAEVPHRMVSGYLTYAEPKT